MSYAKFATQHQAQAYADTVQAALMAQNATNPPDRQYRAQRWSDVITGSDGAFYVSIHATFPPDVETVADIPQTEGGDL